jgi:Zn-dependent peptidase ImmA (M78 family)
VSYNPAILKSVLSARSLTRAELSQRLKLSLSELEAELARDPEPGQGILKSIAEELSLPPFIFFMEELPETDGVLPDFRSATPTNTPKSRPTVETIQLARSVQKTAIELKTPPAAKLPNFQIGLQPKETAAFALEARKFFDITLEDQTEAKSAQAFYVACRKKIEDKGIFVLQDSFPEMDGSGFCLAHTTHPVIVVNTKRQTRARRLFTLIHELAHVLMGKSGISDPFERHNAIERQCNRFAGSFLVPASYVSKLLKSSATGIDPDPDDVKRASNKLKISHEATALRLEQLGIYKSGSYEKWKSLTHNENPDWKDKGGGRGVPPDQEKVKLARYGFNFARVFDQPLRQELISEINLFRRSGLKPKYQRDYFNYAKSITAEQLHSLELEDE